uniref:hypothetical protein n=1 Tax=Pseudomonas fluorescens TaxID=294 RepID=UPI00155DB13D|nr:hypothetical protein [Pseudomonas fluorescens]
MASPIESDGTSVMSLRQWKRASKTWPDDIQSNAMNNACWLQLVVVAVLPVCTGINLCIQRVLPLATAQGWTIEESR